MVCERLGSNFRRMFKVKELDEGIHFTMDSL